MIVVWSLRRARPAHPHLLFPQLQLTGRMTASAGQNTHLIVSDETMMTCVIRGRERARHTHGTETHARDLRGAGAHLLWNVGFTWLMTGVIGVFSVRAMSMSSVVVRPFVTVTTARNNRSTSSVSAQCSANWRRHSEYRATDMRVWP